MPLLFRRKVFVSLRDSQNQEQNELQGFIGKRIGYRLQKYGLLCLLLLFAALAWFFNLQQYLNFSFLQEKHILLTEFVRNRYVLAVAIYAVIYVVLVAMAFPFAVFMTIVGGYLFGYFIGTVVAVIAATLGACLLYLALTLFMHDMLQKKAKPFIENFRQGFLQHAFTYLLTIRLIATFPFVVVNIVTAYLAVPLRIFFAATLLGIIPGTFVYASLGVALREVIMQDDFRMTLLLQPKVYLAFVGLGLLALLPLLYQRLWGDRKQ
jgi:uncharacterized membrane protein YdjX (TVP38/TMEM64 family)